MKQAADEAGSTRSRLLASGLRLFAERGFAQVGVGDVEQAAGLVPRRGGMYRHFVSKVALLEAAVEHHLESTTQAGGQFLEVPEEDLTGAAQALGRRILAEMDAQRDITRVLERDGDRLPELRERFRERISDTAYTTVAAILRNWVRARNEAADRTTEDLTATAVLLVGALVNARRSAWTFERQPAGQDDTALIAAWATLWSATVDNLAETAGPTPHHPAN